MEPRKKNKMHLKKYAAGLLASTVLFNTSCSVFQKEKPNKPLLAEIQNQKQSHYDGNDKNGGIISYVENRGFKITENAARRYTELTKIYGGTMLPVISVGEGLAYYDDGIYLSNQYMAEFITMNEKYKGFIK